MKVARGAGLQVMLAEGWNQARREWAGNERLRWGVRLIAATLVVWLALMCQDQAAAWRAEADEAQAQAERLRPLRTETQWSQRAEEARLQLESARALLWTAASQGQAEAMLQDRLREMCAKAGLPIRELALVATDARLPVDDTRPLRARLVLDVANRLALMGLLSEMSQSPQLMIVEALRLRPQAVPVRAEIEVRVLYREMAKAS